MRHDPQLARIAASTVDQPDETRLVRDVRRYERCIVLSLIGVAIAAFGLIPARAIVAIVPAALRAMGFAS